MFIRVSDDLLVILTRCTQSNQNWSDWGLKHSYRHLTARMVNESELCLLSIQRHADTLLPVLIICKYISVSHHLYHINKLTKRSIIGVHVVRGQALRHQGGLPHLGLSHHAHSELGLLILLNITLDRTGPGGGSDGAARHGRHAGAAAARDRPVDKDYEII